MWIHSVLQLKGSSCVHHLYRNAFAKFVLACCPYMVKDLHAKLIYFAREFLQYDYLTVVTRQAHHLLYLRQASMNIELLLGDGVWALSLYLPPWPTLEGASCMWCGGPNLNVSSLFTLVSFFIADSLDLVPNGGPLLHHSPASFA